MSSEIMTRLRMARTPASEGTVSPCVSPWRGRRAVPCAAGPAIARMRAQTKKSGAGGRVSAYRVSIDIGGTFTDCVVSDGARLAVVKAPSTPPAFERGFLDALALAAQAFDTALPDFLACCHRQRDRGILVEGGVDPLLAGEQAGGAETFAVRQRVPAMGAGDHPQAAGVGATVGERERGARASGLSTVKPPRLDSVITSPVPFVYPASVRVSDQRAVRDRRSRRQDRT